MSAADPRRELIARAEEVRSKLLLRLDNLPQGIPLSDVQRKVLSGVLSGMSGSVKKAEGLLQAEIDASKRDGAYRDCEQALASLERAARVVDSVMDQRADARVVQGLQFADRSCLDGFGTVAFGKATVSPRPPIVVIEPGDGPAMTPPDTQLVVPSLVWGGEKIDVPVPFVYIPRSYVRAPWMLSTLQHEVGHYIDHLLGTSAALKESLQLATNDDDTRMRLEHWKPWLPEIVADVWGVVLGGADFAWTLGLILDGRGRSRFSASSRVYPPTPIRLAILAETLRVLELQKWVPRLGALQDAPAIVNDEYNEAPLYAGDVPRVVGAVFQAANIPKDNAALEQDQIIDQVATAILDSGKVKLPAGARVRHLASAARRALDRDPTAAERIAERVFTLSEAMKAEPWFVSQATLEFLGEAEYFRPTAVDETTRTWKSPPVRLLETHDRVAFVGATNHQLVDKLEEAQKTRQRLYASLEFFFLSDERLKWLVTAAVSHATLKARRDAAMSAIAKYLLDKPDRTASWAFYFYDRPHYFASYWDWDKPNGRIHVSPYVWGKDVGDCPGIDFVRGSDPPHRYLAYVAGLEALRKTEGTERIDGNC